jgi:hypothetical protein
MTSQPVNPKNPVSPETIQRYVGEEGIVGPAHAAKLAVEAYDNKEIPLSQFFAKIATDFSFSKALSSVDGDNTTISWKDLAQLAAGKDFIAKADVGTVPELDQDTLSNLVALSKLRPIAATQSVWNPYGTASYAQAPYAQGMQGGYPPQQAPYGQGMQGGYPPQQAPYGQGMQGGDPPQQAPYGQDPYAQQQSYGQDPYANAGFGLNASYPQPYAMPHSGSPSYNVGNMPYYPVQPTPQAPIYNIYKYYNTTNNYNTYNNQAYNTYNNQAYNQQRYNMPMNYTQFNNSGNTLTNMPMNYNQYNTRTNMPFFNQQQMNISQYQPKRPTMPAPQYGGMLNMTPNQYGGGGYSPAPQYGGMPTYGGGRMFPI